MSPTEAAPISCPNCKTQFTAPIERVIDAQRDPEAKARLLNGQLNVVQCPNCGFHGALAMPILYHDAELEIAYVFVPMEAGLDNTEQQRLIGQLTGRVMDQLPPEQRKGYLLQPKTFFSVQRLIEAILQEDEATREALELQQRKVELVEDLKEIDPQDSLALADFVGQHDDELDPMFFQFLNLFIEMNRSGGQAESVANMEQIRDKLLDLSTLGKVAQAQEEAVAALNEDPSRETLIDQLVAAKEPEVRQALITVGRGLLDYAFFQELTTRIDEAEDEAEKEKLLALRKEVQSLRDEVDARTQAVLQSRAELLRELLMAEDPAQLAAQRLYEIDDLFFSVLNANLQQAQQAGDRQSFDRLQKVGNAVVQVVQASAPPEIQLINQLMQAREGEQDTAPILEAQRHLLNENFFQFVERMSQDLRQNEQEEAAEWLQEIGQQARELV